MAARTLISEKDALEIKKRIWKGETYLTIAIEFDVSQMAISHVATGRRYPEVRWPDGSDGPFPISRVKVLNRTKDAARVNKLMLERREARYAARKEREEQLLKQQEERRQAKLDPDKLTYEDGLAYAKTLLAPDDPSDMLSKLEDHIEAILEVRKFVTQESINTNLAQHRRIYRQHMEDRVTKNRRRKKSL